MNSTIRNLFRRASAVAILSMLAIPSSANAAIVWNWSSSATEAGTFTTKGTLADLTGSFNFEITDFTVTESVISALVGQPYTENQPNQGFLWDGAGVTQFYRDGGVYTNGSNFYVTDTNSDDYSFLFYIDGDGQVTGFLSDESENTVSDFGTTLITISPVPEPGSNLAMLALGVGGLTLRRRLKAKTA